MSSRTPLGLYVHVPFCDGKCPYCDFYSLAGDGAVMDRYAARLMEVMDPYAGEPVKTVYFGGGTPNLLGENRLGDLLTHIFKTFHVLPRAEVTLEANPTHVDFGFFEAVRRAGFNRLSMGLQSADAGELAFLGRRHAARDAEQAVKTARQAGFENISLDLMLALPGQSWETLKKSADFAAGLGVEHISAYMLKVEEGTPFARRGVEPLDPDESAELYLKLVEHLKGLGYRQYEISNFARKGLESQHNLVYWQGEEYLGFGPGAHSFYQGKRFYYDRDLTDFLAGASPCPDGEGGGFEEFAMLNLRLARGLRRAECREKFGGAGEAAFEKLVKQAEKCPPGLVQADRDRIAFTAEGFLVSNALLARLLDGLEE